MDELDKIKIPKIDPGTYMHSKSGKKYKVIGIALHEETLEPMVIYRPLYESKVPLWARSHAVFFESISIDGKSVPRFQKIA